MWIAVESVHAVTYFAPVCRQALRDAGLKGFWAGYFAARAAPLGRVGAGAVTAAFFNFHPAMVRRAIPGCWDSVAPDALTGRRARAAAGALSDLGPAADLGGLCAVLPLLRRAAGQTDSCGRLLTGANRELWPALAAGFSDVSERELGLAEAWQCCTTLREHRGDGHVAALVAHDLRGLDAHILVTGVRGTPIELLRDNRGWSEQEWQDGVDRLIGRGLLEPGGTATPAGIDLHRAIEELTDQLAAVPFATLGEAELHALRQALQGAAAAVQSSGVLPFPNPMGLPRL